MIIWSDTNERTTRSENAHTLFRQSKKMYEIAFLSVIFNEEDVLYHGNCGFEALILCLWYAGLLPKIVHPIEREDTQWTENERNNDLATWRRAIAKIRSLMFRFYISNLKIFRGLVIEGEDEELQDPELEVYKAGTYPREPLADMVINNANDITDVYGQAESTAAFASANPEESTTHTSVKKNYGGKVKNSSNNHFT